MDKDYPLHVQVIPFNLSIEKLKFIKIQNLLKTFMWDKLFLCDK